MLHIRRKYEEVSDFLRQCKRELLSWKNSQIARNSDLRGYSFASTPDRKVKKKKQLWQAISKKFKKKRAPVDTSYTTNRSAKDLKNVWLVPVVCLFLAVGLFVAVGGPDWFGRQVGALSFFKVRNIHYSGCQVVSEEEIRQLSGISLYQTSLLGIDQEQVVSNIVQHPWVSQASVKRNWPTDIVISITEHSPVALMNVENQGKPQLFYVDWHGNPFLQLSAGDDVDYPVITGLDRVSDEQEKKAIFNEVYAFIRAVSVNNPNLPAQSVSEIHINDQGELVIYLVDYTFPIFFGRGEIDRKYERLLSVLRSLYRGRGKGGVLLGVEYIRMDYYNGKVLVAQNESS